MSRALGHRVGRALIFPTAWGESQVAEMSSKGRPIVDSGRRASQVGGQQEERLGDKKELCVVEEQVWVAHGRRRSWKVDEDQVVKNHIKELGLCLEETGVLTRGRAVQDRNGDVLKARPPVRGLLQWSSERPELGQQ